MRDGWKHPSLFLFGLCFLLSACAIWGRSERADRLALEHGWAKARYTSRQFELAAYEHFTAPRGELRVYIEGDGLAWRGRYTPSTDPTPTAAHALEMAVEDPSANVLYLARPCQFLTRSELAHCSPDYWLEARYAPEVVAALNDSITQAKRKSGATRVTLLGYSGGGSLAVLVAARRDDVGRIVTIAANLDHGAWTGLDNTSPLTKSLNAADYARQVQAIPQVHFIGERDKVVPASVTNAYLARTTDRRNIKVVTVEGASHECCWAERWRELLARHVPPSGG
jgi:fermentation-respiration switch protein FrsA (DUF1100 family)